MTGSGGWRGQGVGPGANGAGSGIPGCTCWRGSLVAARRPVPEQGLRSFPGNQAGANATDERVLRGKGSATDLLRHFCVSDQFHYTVARFTVPGSTVFLKFAVNRFQAGD